jgi:hypothetical protein
MSDPHPGPYYSNFGPKDAGLRLVDSPSELDVFGLPAGPRIVIGQAVLAAARPGPHGSIALFRLAVGEQELPGLWECVAREFVPAAE